MNIEKEIIKNLLKYIHSQIQNSTIDLVLGPHQLKINERIIIQVRKGYVNEHKPHTCVMNDDYYIWLWDYMMPYKYGSPKLCVDLRSPTAIDDIIRYVSNLKSEKK